MDWRGPAIVLAARPQGETAALGRFLTEEHGVVAAYVAGGRGRRLRPVLVPGNRVELRLSAPGLRQLPFAAVELTGSRAPLLAEPLAAAAIGWLCALTATALPERQAYPRLFMGLDGVLEAIAQAGSARGWAGAVVGFERLLLRELGYGGAEGRPEGALRDILAAMDALARPLDDYLLADRRGDVMAARLRLRELLGRIET